MNRVGGDEEGEEARLAALERREAHVVHLRERICVELMTSDRKLEASREGSKRRIDGT